VKLHVEDAREAALAVEAASQGAQKNGTDETGCNFSYAKAMLDLVHFVIPPLPERFTYLVPEEYTRELAVGCQLTVSFGRRIVQAFVVGRETSNKELADFPYTLKAIQVDDFPSLSFLPEQLPLLQWVADYYGDTLSNVLNLAVPRLTELRRKTTIELLPHTESLAPLRGAREKEIYAALQSSSEIKNDAPKYDILTRERGVSTILKKLEMKGFIKLHREELLEKTVSPAGAPEWAKRVVELNEQQTDAVNYLTEKINTNSFETCLLFGVTGSGKTEVYIEAAQAALKCGKSVIVLVPEIALTPQLIDRFQARLGDDLAILHSGLSARKRWSSWQSLVRGKTRVALGARSAVFAPIANIGLVIVDEEHDSSYKQSEGLRYNGRDVAIALAQRAKCPVVLGSATPALETYAKALEGKYKMLSLGARHSSGSQITIDVIDLNKTKPWEMASKHVSMQLKFALAEALGRGEQAFVLYNRRGFANYMHCEKCEEPIKCENCSVTMTVHRALNSIVCHYCGLSFTIPSFCSHCETTEKLVERGGGTEQIYDELVTLFPGIAIERLDRDSAGDHDSYRALLNRMRSGEVQLVVGTQMIAKGHDLPGVTVVGVADSDVGLHLPDFRAAERVFNLLTQAAGRAGRGAKPGKVFLQTRQPSHASLVMTVNRDYESFAAMELKNRFALGYPPFSRLMRIVASSQEKSLVHPFLIEIKKTLAAHVQKDLKTVVILGPAAAPLEKLKTLWRAHLLVKSPKASELNRALQIILPYKTADNRIRLTVDIDPQEML